MTNRENQRKPMRKKVTIDLTYSAGKLWWSSDGRVNWGIVGPKSPYTVLPSGADIDWIGDKTIDEITITPISGSVLESIEGDKKKKKGKVGSKCKCGDKCKYNITIIASGTKESFTVDPDIDVCNEKDPNDCPEPA